MTTMTQAERRARTLAALLESAARGLSRYGYGNLVLERVASDAGYTRGALYHLFASKEDLVLAVISWVEETWWAEVGTPAAANSDPVDNLMAIARGHAVYCRRDVARVMLALRIEFNGREHAVERALGTVLDRLLDECTQLIRAARRSGRIPAGPPARKLALAFLGGLEGAVEQLAGQAPYDEVLAARVAAGVLGLQPELD